MGRAEIPGPFQLPVVDVDTDDRGRSGQLRSDDGPVTDAAAAEHRHAVTAAHSPGVDRRADTGHDPATQQTGHRRGRRRIYLRTLPGSHEGCLGESADSQSGRQFGAVLEGHLLGGVVGAEADVGPALEARTALATHGSPVEDYEVTGSHLGHTRTYLFHHTCRLMAEEEGVVVAYSPFPVVEVRVTDSTGLDRHNRLTRSGIGDDDVLHRDGLPHRH